MACSSTLPTSNRLISRRSSTSVRNRVMSLDSKSRAVRARSGRSSRVFSSTSTDAVNVIKGERSSWLTSEAKRASRSIRSSKPPAISLNDATKLSKSSSPAGSRRVSSLPPAIASAAPLTSRSGARALVAANRPARAARAATIKMPPKSTNCSVSMVSSTSVRGKDSKYTTLLKPESSNPRIGTPYTIAGES